MDGNQVLVMEKEGNEVGVGGFGVVGVGKVGGFVQLWERGVE
jgi:hypothetical protein